MNSATDLQPMRVSKEPVCIYLFPAKSRARILKLSRSPRIDSKEPIPPDCVNWRAGTTTLFLLRFYLPAFEISCHVVPPQEVLQHVHGNRVRDLQFTREQLTAMLQVEDVEAQEEALGAKVDLFYHKMGFCSY
jgi:hypothetical protein